MEFNQLKNAVKGIPFETLRLDSAERFEAVIVKGELVRLRECLEKFFGSPVFPSKKSLTLEISQLINGFGGIFPGQTIYFWSQGKEAIFTMLWPWNDGQHTTVKIIRQASAAKSASG